MTTYIRQESEVGGYRLEAQRSADVYDYRSAGADLLGCGEDEIAFAGSATSAWWAALNAVPLNAGDRVLATTAEYSSNVFGLIQLRARGVDVELIPSDANGEVCVESLQEMMDERVKLVCVTHVPTEGGLVNPVADVGAVLSTWPALYLLDACQSVGQFPISVEEVQCDFLAATGRKYLRAPRGTGLLYVRRGLAGLHDPSPIDLRSAVWTKDWGYDLAASATRFETFESSAAGRVGLGVALRYAASIGLENIAGRIAELANQLRASLGGVDGVQLCELGGAQSGLVTFTVQGHDGTVLRDALAGVDITVAAVQPTHAAFDPSRRGAETMVRASVHYFNTASDIERLVEAINVLMS